MQVEVVEQVGALLQEAHKPVARAVVVVLPAVAVVPLGLVVQAAVEPALPMAVVAVPVAEQVLRVVMHPVV